MWRKLGIETGFKTSFWGSLPCRWGAAFRPLFRGRDPGAHFGRKINQPVYPILPTNVNWAKKTGPVNFADW
jgi:hypothetical protein